MCEWDILLTPQKENLDNLRTQVWYVPSRPVRLGLSGRGIHQKQGHKQQDHVLLTKKWRNLIG